MWEQNGGFTWLRDTPIRPDCEADYNYCRYRAGGCYRLDFNAWAREYMNKNNNNISYLISYKLSHRRRVLISSVVGAYTENPLCPVATTPAVIIRLIKQICSSASPYPSPRCALRKCRVSRGYLDTYIIRRWSVMIWSQCGTTYYLWKRLETTRSHRYLVQVNSSAGALKYRCARVL